MDLRVPCDEHVPPQTAEYLQKDGHDAAHVVEALGSGTDDPEIASYAVAEEYALLTNDTDFLDASRYPKLTVFYCGESDAPAWDLAAAIADVESHLQSADQLPRTVFL